MSRGKGVGLMRRKALAFLDLARYSMERGYHGIAVLNAEKSDQLYLKGALLELIGDCPRTRSLMALSELARILG